MSLAPGTSAVLKRRGRHSALGVAGGTLRVKNLKGEVLIDRLGLEDGWDGSAASDEAFVLADRGDLILESIGQKEAIVYDAVRPVPGVPLPALIPSGPGRAVGDAASSAVSAVFGTALTVLGVMRNGITAAAKRIFLPQKKSWVETNVPELADYTVVSR